jgi:hypothetical protein
MGCLHVAIIFCRNDFGSPVVLRPLKHHPCLVKEARTCWFAFLGFARFAFVMLTSSTGLSPCSAQHAPNCPTAIND